MPTCYLEADSSCTLDCLDGYTQVGSISCDGGVLTHTAECEPMGCDLADLGEEFIVDVFDVRSEGALHTDIPEAQERPATYHAHHGETVRIGCAADHRMFMNNDKGAERTRECLDSAIKFPVAGLVAGDKLIESLKL